ncbi:MAG: cupin, partial [Bacteroidetes bacterium]|nr:cupin [Bacteroidota bacterium]
MEAQTIFGAEVLENDAFSLSSCMVAPGFEFSDFQLYDQQELIGRFPELSQIISH